MKIIEVTGIAGVGKSYILTLLSKNNHFTLDKDIIKKYNLNDFKLLIYFFKNKNSLYTIHAIIKIALLLQIPFLHKMNFIRNSIKKFGKHYFITSSLETNKKLTIVIDEGITHLYQNIVTHKKNNHREKEKNREIHLLIENLIQKSNINHQIVIVIAEKETVYNRLKMRGHKRIKSEEEIASFIKMGEDNINALKKIFKNIIQINNNPDSNLEFELKKIIGK